MRFRKLRIVWSVSWGIAAVLLCVLWARSYSWWDELYTPTSVERYYSPASDSGVIIVESASGRVTVCCKTSSGEWYWHVSLKLNGRYWNGEESEYRSKGFAGFALYSPGGSYHTLRLPDWFLVLTSLGLAAMPWLRWARRFSLRTLLIATTLVAVILGLIGWLL